MSVWEKGSVRNQGQGRRTNLSNLLVNGGRWCGSNEPRSLTSDVGKTSEVEEVA